MNAITEKEFKLLTLLEKAGGSNITQRELANEAGFSLGTANKLLADLNQRGLIDKTKLTEAGFKALEPYRVKRAVLIAAGFGTRLVPITLNTPKPLVRVKGERIIDSLLDALQNVGIEEIYIVRGYFGEQFDQLLYKYPNIQFVENPIYNEANNISSALVAAGLLQNAYVLESDLLLANPDLITKYQYASNYIAFPVERTDDWFFRTKHGFIEEVGVGGTDCYRMCGISYWSAEDGKKLAQDIADVFEMPGGRERYWDEVPLHYKKDNYRVMVRECREDDLVEIDTLKELQELDPSYCM